MAGGSRPPQPRGSSSGHRRPGLAYYPTESVSVELNPHPPSAAAPPNRAPAPPAVPRTGWREPSVLLTKAASAERYT